jgi:hypothetical protein
MKEQLKDVFSHRDATYLGDFTTFLRARKSNELAFKKYLFP